jgi:uncharacterized protein YggU (UPF0235/DUF167 family)
MAEPVKINVRIKPRSKRPKVEKTEDGYTVYVSEPPVENKANKALLESLSEHLGVPKSRLSIVSGLKSKNKIVEIGSLR